MGRGGGRGLQEPGDPLLRSQTPSRLPPGEKIPSNGKAFHCKAHSSRSPKMTVNSDMGCPLKTLRRSEWK